MRSFERDRLGRLIHDRVTTLASGVDGAVRRLSIGYEVRGMAERFTSYDNRAAGSGTVANEVLRAFNSFAQPTSEYQEHSGAVSTSTSPKVQYGYANGSANTIRPTAGVYPNGRQIDYSCGASGGMDDQLSRVAALKDGSTELAKYTYVGGSLPSPAGRGAGGEGSGLAVCPARRNQPAARVPHPNPPPHQGGGREVTTWSRGRATIRTTVSIGSTGWWTVFGGITGRAPTRTGYSTGTTGWGTGNIGGCRSIRTTCTANCTRHLSAPPHSRNAVPRPMSHVVTKS